jgi:hypothetical protein
MYRSLAWCKAGDTNAAIFITWSPTYFLSNMIRVAKFMENDTCRARGSRRIWTDRLRDKRI